MKMKELEAEKEHQGISKKEFHAILDKASQPVEKREPDEKD